MLAERNLLAVRRLAAWCVDWLAILAYAALLVPIGVLLVAHSVSLPPAVWNAISFGGLITPATLWLTVWEHGRHGATPGKRLLGLRVSTGVGGRPGLARALARNAVKVALPWELGHTAAFTLAAPATPTAVGLAGSACGLLACGIVGVYVASLFVGARRTPYDRAAGTRVERT